jgi:hypothetical protein
VFKLCLQVVFCLTIGLRVLLIFGYLRRAWQGEGRRERSLAAEFRQELRRRGLLMSLPPRGSKPTPEPAA